GQSLNGPGQICKSVDCARRNVETINVVPVVAFLRVATGVYQCPALQGRARPAYRSGSHYRNRFGIVPLSQNLAKETQRAIPGGRCSILLPLRPPGYAPAERNSILLIFNVPGWARLNRRSGPNQLAKSIAYANPHYVVDRAGAPRSACI